MEKVGGGLCSKFKRHSGFYIQSGKYSEPADRATHFLMSHATTYVYVGEVTFSVLNALLSKYKSKLSTESDLRLQLINI